MQLYSFEVLKGEEIIAAEASVPLARHKSRMAKNCKDGEENHRARLPHPGARAIRRDDHSDWRGSRAALRRSRRHCVSNS